MKNEATKLPLNLKAGDRVLVEATIDVPPDENGIAEVILLLDDNCQTLSIDDHQLRPYPTVQSEDARETLEKHDCRAHAAAYAVWTGDEDQRKRQLIGNVYACGWCQKIVRDGRWKIDTVDEIAAKARFKAACRCTYKGECYGHMDGDPCRVCACDPNATVQANRPVTEAMVNLAMDAFYGKGGAQIARHDNMGKDMKRALEAALNG